jgi:hypothetical protein
MNVEREICYHTSSKWSHRNTNKSFKELVGSHNRTTFNRLTTKESCTWHITHNMGSPVNWNLKLNPLNAELNPIYNSSVFLPVAFETSLKSLHLVLRLSVSKFTPPHIQYANVVCILTTLDPWSVSASFIDVSAHPTRECTHRSMLHAVRLILYSVECTMTIMCNLWLRRGASDRCQNCVWMWQKLWMYGVGVVTRVMCVGIMGTIYHVWITQGLASLFAWSNGTTMPNDGNQFLISVLLEKRGFQQHDVRRSRRRVT